MEFEQQRNKYADCPATSDNLFDDVASEVFSNELILEEITEHLDANDLLAFRQVCSDWYRNSNKSFREKACLQLKKPKCEPNTTENGTSTTTLPTTELLQQFNDSTNNGISLKSKVPFKKYALHYWDFSQGLNTEEEEIFWETYGPHIKHLRVHKCSLRFMELDFIKQIMGGVLAPNMESLVVENCDYTWYPDLPKNLSNYKLKRLELSGPFPASCWFFLKMFPNLVELKLSKLCSNEEILRGVFRLRKVYPTILNITKLDIMDTDQSLTVVPGDLPLKHLTFRICYRVSPHHVRNILENYSNSLESLAMFRTSDCDSSTFPNFSLHGITFRKLESLEIWGNFNFDFNFLRSTPCLKKLRVDIKCYEKRDIIEYYYPCGWNTDKVCQKKGLKLPKIKMENEDKFAVESLREFVTDLELELCEWRNVKTWMPGLVKIEAPLNNKTLSAVCANWEKLEGLKLRFPSNVDDEGVTGYAGMEAVQVESRLPNITDLKYLESFETQVGCGMGELTDISASMAFLKMPSLKNLKIYISNQMSSETVEKLEQSIDRVRVYRNSWVGSDNPKDRQECCVWAKFHHRFLKCHCKHCKPKEMTWNCDKRRRFLK